MSENIKVEQIIILPNSEFVSKFNKVITEMDDLYKIVSENLETVNYDSFDEISLSSIPTNNENTEVKVEESDEIIFNELPEVPDKNNEISEEPGVSYENNEISIDKINEVINKSTHNQINESINESINEQVDNPLNSVIYEQVYNLLDNIKSKTDCSNVKGITSAIGEAITELNKENLSALDKKDIIQKAMINLIDNTNFSDSLEKFDPAIKELIPNIIDNVINIEDNEIKINKNFLKKLKYILKELKNVIEKLVKSFKKLKCKKK